MSLINDALKRAKEVQAANPPGTPENLHLRPADPATQPKNGIGLVLPATAATVLLAAVFSFWQLRSGNHATARSPSEVIVHATALHSVPPAPEPESIEPSAPINAGNASAASNSPVPVAAQVATQTNSSPVSKPESPKPPPQLKAIVFNPTHPSALIDGKTVFVGDKVREFRVTAITPVSATLASPAHTNVLTLE